MEAAIVVPSVLATLAGWTASALSAAFLAVRLGVYAVLVVAAWKQFIEGAEAEQQATRQAKRQFVNCAEVEGEGGSCAAGTNAGALDEGGGATGKLVLNSETLQAHNKRSGGGGAQRRAHRPQLRRPSTELSDDDESIEGWSIWGDEESVSEASTPAARQGQAQAPVAPVTPTATGGRAPAAAPVSTSHAPSLTARGPHPHVTATRVPASAAPGAGASGVDAGGVADVVLPGQTAELAEDEEEKQVLAGAAMVSGGQLAEAGRAAKHHRGGGRHGGGKKQRKPWLSRKIEALVKPYSDKYAGTGYMVYKGFNRMGKRMEAASFCLAHNMDGAIRDAGCEAIDRLEYVARKWVKFAGVVAFLTVALLPLPSVHITLSMG